ncbi:transposase, partial [Candidatus Harpocratesius sp.]
MIKGSKMVKGTTRIRHYHGAMIHGLHKSLYIGCHHVAKGESKIPFMLDIVDWLLNLGLKIKVCVIDREYYRQNILKSFKNRGIHVITPAKNYKQLKNAKREYILGNKGRIQTFTIRTKNKKNRKRKLTRCWVHLFPRGKQRLNDLKSAYRQGQLSLDKVCEQLYGLITTIAPQYRSKSFVYLIKRYYKMRWQIETAFRDVDIHKGLWRSNDDGTRLFAEMGKYLLFNFWQIERDQIYPNHQMTFQEYRDWLVDEFTQTIN